MQFEVHTQKYLIIQLKQQHQIKSKLIIESLTLAEFFKPLEGNKNTQNFLEHNNFWFSAVKCSVHFFAKTKKN